MTVDLTQMLSKDGHVRGEMKWGDDVVSFTYDANAYTPEVEAQVLAGADESPAGGLADLLARLLVSWDVTNEGSPFPPTRQNLGTFPVTFLAKLLTTLAKEMGADPLSDATSVASS